MNSKQKGDISQAKIEMQLLLKGYTVLTPRGDNNRYDFVIEKDNNKFERVQCKTGRLKDGSIIFSACSSSYHRNGKKHPYDDKQIGYFGVYCPQLDKCYLVPIDKANWKDTATLRVDKPKKRNNRIKFASDFEILV